ncbi:MAG: PEP-CTERM sorting domain-containing protein [Gemmatimonadota bacterium]
MSLTIHEFGHILGFSSAFADFAAGIIPSADNARSIYVFGSDPTLGDRTLDYLASTAPNSTMWGAVYMPDIGTGANSEGEDAATEAGSVGNFPSHLDDRSLAQPPSAALFPMDVMNSALNMSERRLISFADLDILSDAYGYTVVPEPGTLPLVLLGVLGLAAARRREAV